MSTENVNINRCIAGRCSDTFVPPSDLPSSYDSVSVAAENVVGIGAAGNLTTQPISKLKFAIFHFENTETSPVFVPRKGVLYSNCWKLVQSLSYAKLA